MNLRAMTRLILIVFLFWSCGQRSNQSDKSASSEGELSSAFYDLLEQLPELKTPLKFRSDRELDGGNASDELLARIRGVDPNFHPYGKLYQTDKFIAVVTVASADIVMPILATFSKDGKIISTINLYQTAGGDMGYYSTNITVLTGDKEILMTDSTITRKLNSDRTYEIPGTDSVTISKKKFRINGNGTIEEVK